MKFPLFLFCILFIACNRNDNSGKLDIATETVKHFDDAKTFKPDWSKQNTIIVHLITDPDNLHPINGISYVRSEILPYIHRSLLNFDYKTSKVVPGLVVSMPEISADSLHYTYTLRKNVTWDDGSELSAADVIFTAKAFKCPLTNDAPVRSYWNNIKDITDNKDGSFTIEMFKKNFQNVSFLSAFPVIQQKIFDPENALNKFSFAELNDTTFEAKKSPALVSWSQSFNDDANGRDPQRITGLGMYRLAEWQQGQYITLIRKQNHWTQNSTDYHETSYPDKIVFRINKDEASQILDFRNQNFDVSLNCTINVLAELSTDKNFTDNYNSALIPTYNYTYVGFNEKPDSNRTAFFADVNVRKALAMLTPVDQVIKIVYRDFGKDCRRMVTNVSPFKSEFDNSLQPIDYNEAEAKKLLAQSGWKDTDNDGILDKIINGKKIQFEAELNYLTSSPEWKSMALYLSEQYAKAGLRISPVGMEQKPFIEKARAHDFDLMLASWGGTGLPEDYTQLWHTNSWKSHGSNYPGFGNEDSDKLIESMKLEQKDSIRNSMSHRLQKMIYDDQPMIFLYTSLRRNVIHKRFGNQYIFSDRPGLWVNDLKLLSR
jgi:ABC-type transport system substrate-binding protein